MASAALHAAFGRLLADWPELAGFCGADCPRLSLSPLDPGLARERAAALAALADTAEAGGDPEDAALLRQQAAFFGWLLELGRWRKTPDVLSELSALLVRQALAASAEPREKARLEGWLDSLGQALPPGREGRERPDPEALELARESARGVRAQVAALRGLCAESAVAAAERALAEHLAWLEGLRPGPALRAPGPELGAELLLRRGIAESPAELAALFQEEAERCRAALGPELGAVRAYARSRSAADFPALLGALRDALAASAAAAPKAGFPAATMARCEVLATPEALAPGIPGAAVLTPRPMLPGEPALVLMTEPPELTDRPLAGLRNLAAHEGSPGHLLQAALANAAGRPWRAVDLCPIPGHGAGLFACDLMEGWAHFVEERLAEAGFHRPGAETFVQRDEALWRAVRAQVDLGLLVGDLDRARAQALLVRQAGLAEEDASSEVADYRLAPTYGLSYLYGKLALRRLRARWAGPEPELYQRLLALGLTPLSLAERWLGTGEKPAPARRRRKPKGPAA